VTPEPGAQVNENVTLIRILGEGGMGHVWLGKHASLDVEVAVKFVSKELADKDPKVVERFRREAALAAKLKSPHVVRIFDHGVCGDTPYIVMERLEGETLAEVLARGERLPPRETALVVSQVAQVLAEAHAAGIVHRDIKPDNVFLIESSYELFAKVLDFGIAKNTVPMTSDLTGSGAILGTPGYMSPERLLSTEDNDPHSDVWALAVLAYNLLCGEAPFKGETLPALSLAICESRFEPPGAIDSQLPAELDSWFARAFSAELDDRFTSVDELASTLGYLVSGNRSSQDRSLPGRRSNPTPQSDAEWARVAQDPTLPSAPSLDNPTAPHESAVVRLEEAHSVDDPLDDCAAAPRRVHATSEDTAIAGQSPTFSGAASTVAAPTRRGWTWTRIAVLLAAATALLVGIDRALQDESGPASETTTSAVATTPAPQNGATATTTTTATSAASSTAATSAKPQVSSAAPARSISVPPRRPPQPPANDSKPDCSNPYLVGADGVITIRPECL